MIRREDAVAVGEQDVRRDRSADAGVPAASQLEAVVRMGTELQRERRRLAEVGDHVGGFVLRTVVGDDHFELTGDALLSGER